MMLGIGKGNIGTWNVVTIYTAHTLQQDSSSNCMRFICNEGTYK